MLWHSVWHLHAHVVVPDRIYWSGTPVASNFQRAGTHSVSTNQTDGFCQWHWNMLPVSTPISIPNNLNIPETVTNLSYQIINSEIRLAIAPQYPKSWICHVLLECMLMLLYLCPQIYSKDIFANLKHTKTLQTSENLAVGKCIIKLRQIYEINIFRGCICLQDDGQSFYKKSYLYLIENML